MTKKYNTPMLQVISIKKNDIVTGSPFAMSEEAWTSGSEILSPDRRFNVFDSWYEGY